MKLLSLVVLSFAALLLCVGSSTGTSRQRRFAILKEKLFGSGGNSSIPSLNKAKDLITGVFSKSTNTPEATSESSQTSSTATIKDEIGTIGETTTEGFELFLPNGSAVNDFNKTESDGKVCYGVLGCFGRLDFFDAVKRPLNFIPQSPEQIKVKYSLFTAENKFKPQILAYNASEEDLLNIHFDSNKKTKFIIHGFQAEFDDMTWMGDLKDIILGFAPDEFNIFAVDWSGGAKTIIYHQAVANTRVVGAATAYFINKLVQFKNVRVQDIHLIGHSLGAHTSGYIGERFTNPKIGRITGLDPAGPNFYENDPKVRLDPTDATYVDIVHTDFANSIVEGLGLEDAIGHDDFYPNSGYRQPGCGTTKVAFNVLSQGVGAGISSTISCNHQRAYNLFSVNPSSLDEGCQFVGYECDSYSNFEQGKCADCGTDGSKCALMSIWGPDDPANGEQYRKQMQNSIGNLKTNRRLYFKTGEGKPFCMHHYQIIVNFDRTSDSVTGLIKINLHGSQRNISDIKLSQSFSSFEAGTNYTFLITLSKVLGKVEKVDVEFSFGGVQALNPLKIIKKPQISIGWLEANYMSNINPEVRREMSSILCPANTSDINSGGRPTSFVKCSKRPQLSGGGGGGFPFRKR